MAKEDLPVHSNIFWLAAQSRGSFIKRISTYSVWPLRWQKKFKSELQTRWDGAEGSKVEKREKAAYDDDRASSETDTDGEVRQEKRREMKSAEFLMNIKAYAFLWLLATKCAWDHHHGDVTCSMDWNRLPFLHSSSIYLRFTLHRPCNLPYKLHLSSHHWMQHRFKKILMGNSEPWR